MHKKTIFISGAANGIGERTARLFVDKGWFVGLYDIAIEKLEVVAEQLGKENCCYKKCDITSKEDLKEAFAHFSSYTNNKMDVLLANAGVMTQGEFNKKTLQEYEHMVNVNIMGTVNTIYLGLDLLKNTPKSKIIISSGMNAIFGSPYFSIYDGTMSFLKSLTESLSSEFSKYKIGVSSIMPLFVLTDMMDKVDPKYSTNLRPIKVSKKIYYAATKGKKLHYLVGPKSFTYGFLYKVLPIKVFQKMVKR